MSADPLPVDLLTLEVGSTITKATVTEVPTAMPWTKLTPMRNRPRIEITTVQPANSTARPAVSIARTTADSGSSPS